MRTKNAVRNSTYSVVCYMASCLIMLISRKLFISLMGEELLGYDGLFKNVLSLLSVLDMGAGSAITYQLYKVIAEKDNYRINQLMQLYRGVYRIIVVCILAAGCLVIPFLPYIVSDSSIGLLQMTQIYCLQLLGILTTYFMAYKRIRFVAEQQEYICVKIELLANVMAQMIKLLIIYKYQSYWLYLWVTIFQNLICNMIISYKCKKIFGAEDKYKLKKEDYVKWNILYDMKNFMSHKIGILIYGATDNIVISTFMGVSYVTLYTNYTLVINYANTLLMKLVNPLTASVASLVYGDENEKGVNLFDVLDYSCYLLGAFMAGGIITCVQPFISIWLGDKYLLPLGFLILIASNIYIGWVQNALVIFRSSFGDFQNDKKYYLLSAGVNLIVSIILIKPFGFSGIMIGTVAGHVIIGLGRMQFVFKHYLKTSSVIFLRKQIIRMILTMCECFLLYHLVAEFPISFVGIILRGVVVVSILGVINFIVFRKEKCSQMAKIYIHNYIMEIFRKKKQ